MGNVMQKIITLYDEELLIAYVRPEKIQRVRINWSIVQSMFQYKCILPDSKLNTNSSA